jgi:hypothetical protein
MFFKCEEGCVVPEYGPGPAQNPRVVRFDHWGAARSGLQLGEIQTRLILPARRGGRRNLAR